MTALPAGGTVRAPLDEFKELVDRVSWRPMDAAPRDRFILLYVPNGQLETGPVTIGHWYPPFEQRDERGRFNKGGFAPMNWTGWLGTDADHSASWCDPVAWMPLPEPPPSVEFA